MSLEHLAALVWLVMASAGSPVLVDQLPTAVVSAPPDSTADILISPIAPGRASQSDASDATSTAQSELLEECRAAQLRQEEESADCEEALAEANAELSPSVEGTLLRVLGYDTSGATMILDSNQDLQNADTLAANAGSGQGVRAGEAAAIIASQRGGVPPAPPPR